MEILALLPMKSVYTFRCVSKESNALLSNKFISDIWAKRPANREPWLLLCNSFSATPCMAYCFYTKTWKPCLSICKGLTGYRYFHRGSAAGLLLLQKLHTGVNNPLRPSPSGHCPLYVYNPFSQTHIELPRMRFIKKINTSKLIVESGSENSYNVVAVGHRVLPEGEGRESAVEIYESCTKCWRIERQLPNELRVMNESVFLDGTFYCLTMEYNRPGMWILGFNINAPAGTPVVFASLPELVCNSWVPNLIICGSRILIVASTARLQEDVMRTVTIWEFERDDSRGSCLWKEISKMPFIVPFIWFECVGVGETRVCFHPEEGNQRTDLVMESASPLSNVTRSWKRSKLAHGV